MQQRPHKSIDCARSPEAFRTSGLASIGDLFTARKPLSQATRRLFAATVESLTSLAPPDWKIEIARRSDDGGTIRVVSSDGVPGELTVLVRKDSRRRPRKSVCNRSAIFVDTEPLHGPTLVQLDEPLQR
ncbi:MAG: hypothetical protein ACI8TP_004999 [Acidimicrobiales bacterium]|jgi:hypothetical protein